MDLPKGNAALKDEEIHRNQELEQLLSTEADKMGKDLDQIFEILNGNSISVLGKPQIVVEHRWNAQSGTFDKWNFCI